MKAHVLLTFLLVCCGECFGQGVLNFDNRLSMSPAPVFYPDCVTPLSGDAFRAQLYAGPAGAPESGLVPVGDAVPFSTGRNAGFFLGPPIEVPFVPPGQFATLQARVFETAAGSYDNAIAKGFLYGKSNPISVQLNSNNLPGPPAEMTGLQSFCLVPEPSAWALAGFGAALLFWNKRVRWKN